MRPYRQLSSRGVFLSTLKPRAHVRSRFQQQHPKSTKASTPPPDPRQQLRDQLDTVWGPLMPRLKTAIPLLLGLLAGLSIGTLVRETMLHEPVVPGSAEDKQILAALQQRIDKEFKVQIFRGKCLSAGRAIRGDGEGGWVELDTGYLPDDERLGAVRSAELRFEKEKGAHKEQVREAERAIVARGGVGDDEPPQVGHTAAERVEALRQQAQALGLQFDPSDVEAGLDRRFVGGSEVLTTGALGGSRGLAVERVFWNAREQELVAVVWMGDGVCGWPKVVHGGFIATAVGEKAGMAAALLRDTLSDGARTKHHNWRDLESMDVQYKRPTYAAAFYVIRAAPRVVVDAGQRSIEVDSVLETMDGKICVKVKGTSPVSEVDALKTKTETASWRHWLRLW
ncbi:hypothetical protein ANO11243_008440 [Dothideomycetidae sp. 11243]|nr:hypothetical protein ANO11243_008440 [fungal sp. No.11243]